MHPAGRYLIAKMERRSKGPRTVSGPRIVRRVPAGDADPALRTGNLPPGSTSRGRREYIKMRRVAFNSPFPGVSKAGPSAPS